MQNQKNKFEEITVSELVKINGGQHRPYKEIAVQALKNIIKPKDNKK